jgi:uncharacterized protein (TIGR00255 family)
MTGFGQATGDNGRHRVAVTLKGVNHRFLDVRVRLPEEHREREGEVQEILGTELFRGRIDGVVEIDTLVPREARVVVERTVVAAATEAFRELAREGLVHGELTAGDLLRLPEAVRVRLSADRWDEADTALLHRTVGEALAQLVVARGREGEGVAAALEGLRVKLGERVAVLLQLEPEARTELVKGMEERLERFLAGSGVTVDPGRLAQEAAILADKSDVSEELARLGTHLGHLDELLAATGPVGKRLDFLLQEVFRELNTLGAKCRHPPVTRLVLEAKAVAEQMREQVQNVE